jgi:hypothetical protein
LERYLTLDTEFGCSIRDLVHARERAAVLTLPVWTK